MFEQLLSGRFHMRCVMHFYHAKRNIDYIYCNVLICAVLFPEVVLTMQREESF